MLLTEERPLCKSFCILWCSFCENSYQHLSGARGELDFVEVNGAHSHPTRLLSCFQTQEKSTTPFPQPPLTNTPLTHWPKHWRDCMRCVVPVLVLLMLMVCSVQLPSILFENFVWDQRVLRSDRRWAGERAARGGAVTAAPLPPIVDS